MQLKKILSLVVLLLTSTAYTAPKLPLVDSGKPFGKLPLIQEIDCSKNNPDRQFIQLPKDSSKVEQILGKSCRVIPNTLDKASYFAYIIGKNCNLQPGKAYLITVEYPEDQPRSFHIGNWGCETMRGLATGTTVGDILKGKYTNNNSESLRYPLAHKFKTWQQLFWLHDRYLDLKRGRNSHNRNLRPKDGFWVIFAQPESRQAPLSAGIAISKIRLFAIPDIERYRMQINYPVGLPRRHLFWREEMADNVVAFGHKATEQVATSRGVNNREAWYEYKCKMMQVFAMNTFCKDLLEFSHNQGWDSRRPNHGGSDWYNQTADPQHWQRILTMVNKYKFDVLPYYEYAGSIGQDKKIAIGSQRRCRTLKGKNDYTGIPWIHLTNADLADPDFLADAKRLLEYTIVRHKNRANFIGAWFRSRPEATPISFNEKNLKRFAAEANNQQPITRSQLQHDNQLLQRYYQWWFVKRKEFLDGLADFLRKELNPDAFMLYTADSSEPGVSLSAQQFAPPGTKEPWRWKYLVATDQPTLWQNLLNSPRYTQDKRFQFLKVAAETEILAKLAYLQALLAPLTTWAGWEWHHACPQADPQNYKKSDKVMLSYSFNRLYSVNEPQALSAFRTKTQLAIIRHYPLNEHEMQNGQEHILGYFVSDVERAGAFSMAAEALAVANGDPTMIGYLVGNSFNRGFPEYVRNFNAAFLALPALPSRIVKNAAKHPKVIVRAIKTPNHGTYLAIVNSSWDNIKTTVKLPVMGKTINCVTGDAVQVTAGQMTISLYPYQLVTLHIAANI